jgi:glutamine synthetase
MMKDWLRKHPDVRTIRVAAADLNGQARGKRVPARYAENVVKNGTRFPFSILNLDIWGEDIDDSPLVFEQGDADGVLKPTERGFMPMPGSKRRPRCCRSGCSARTASPMRATPATR